MAPVGTQGDGAAGDPPQVLSALEARRALQEEAARIRADALACAERVLAAARRSAADLRADAGRQAEAMLHTARSEAEREANEIVHQALAQVRQEQLRVRVELDAAGVELTRLLQLSAAALDRLGSVRARFGDGSSEGADVVPLRLSAGTVVPGGPSVGGVAPPTTAPVIATAPLDLAMIVGEIDVVLPVRADRTMVEVLMAVLHEQPGIVVRPAVTRDEAVHVPVTVERAMPLVPILLELPRVVGATYSPGNNVSGIASSGCIVVELSA
jgi:hypothetical protein